MWPYHHLFVLNAVSRFIPSRTAVWTANNDKNKILSVGRKLKESLRLPQEMQIHYEFHKEAAFKHGNKTPAYTYTL